MEALKKEVNENVEAFVQIKDYFPNGFPEGVKLRSQNIAVFELCSGIVTYTIDFLFSAPKRTREKIMNTFPSKLNKDPPAFLNISKKYEFNFDYKAYCRTVDCFILATVIVDIKKKSFDQLDALIKLVQ